MAFSLQPAWYKFAQLSLRTMFTFGFSLKTEGQQNVPASGPFLLVGNHQSYIDPPAIGCSLVRPIYYLARRSLWKNSFLGALLTSVNTLPVNQDGSAHEGLRAIMTKLEEGQGVIVFPEGTRTPDGNMNPLQPGILLLLKRLAFSYPVVPVGIAGAFQAWPLQNKLPYLSPLLCPAQPRGPLAISFGKPVPSQAYQGLDRAVILNDLYERIHACWQRAELIKRKPLD